MNRPVTCITALIAGLAMTAAGCTNFDVQSWNPVSHLMPRSYSTDTKFKIARVQEQQGKLAKAQQLYSELYRRDPRNVDVCRRLAVVAARLGDTQQSERFFNEALRLAPNRVDLLTDYGYAKLMDKDYAAAEALLRRALAVAPGDKRATNNLALALGYQGKQEQALAMFRRVVPEAQAQANLAYLHVQRGEGKQAVERYARAVKLDKNLRSASHALLQLAELEQRYLKSERGRKQVARVTAGMKQKADAAAPSDSPAGQHKGDSVKVVDAKPAQKVKPAVVVDTRPSHNVKPAVAVGSKSPAAKDAVWALDTEPQPAVNTATTSKGSARREVEKRPAAATASSASASKNPAAGPGAPAQSEVWNVTTRRQPSGPSPVKHVVYEPLDKLRRARRAAFSSTTDTALQTDNPSSAPALQQSETAAGQGRMTRSPMPVDSDPFPQVPETVAGRPLPSDSQVDSPSWRASKRGHRREQTSQPPTGRVRLIPAAPANVSSGRIHLRPTGE